MRLILISVMGSGWTNQSLKLRSQLPALPAEEAAYPRRREGSRNLVKQRNPLCRFLQGAADMPAQLC